ncbi:hypothetical protein N7468_004845 [Penicillium chermesinum]|uniref:Zn(2)-C6 fungal-type domain-containing protein n=1 Tax=Penicillium chermesinum TaxID=63820 RepID=A0A9W9P934_9EURO|nr:uncharacterized protein N7468_004845 [Penicillium chermesinum]KAJ5240226.1 hypothetical protein N7468_004845 [Penicillium chermesinum]KAJ6167095.1 hypothetical protein N7470_002542 [Penicillium chermesinum]
MAAEARRATTASHTRSFTGCATCRSRHVKCDEGRPACAMCTSFGLPCAGYKKDLFFDSKNPDNRIRFRRPLFTEVERVRMSEWLVSAAPPWSTNRMLAQIDEEGYEDVSGTDFGLQLGPFGVFKVQQSPRGLCRTPSLSVINDPEETSASSPLPDLSSVAEVFTFDTNVSPGIPFFMEALFDSADQGPSPPTPELIDTFINPTHLDNEPVTPPRLPFIDSHSPYFLQLSRPTSLSHIYPYCEQNHSSGYYLLAKALLFNGYQLNDTTLGDVLNHASLGVFYGTLAISALSLGGVSKSDDWLSQARLYFQEAECHAKHMLLTAYDIPKPAKYKSMLMAILTMVQVSTFSGDRDQAEEYFLEAEKLIRLKGLRRRKSRKVRLLHHCYAFERMFHESIFINGANSSHRLNIRRAIESSGLAPCSVDGLSFRLSKWQNLQQEMMRVRDQEEGENDLHLERPGLCFATLYPEIFGIPEPWVQLLSLIIRLGTEKDTAEHESDSSLDLKDFISRAKALEDCINRLQKPKEMTVCLDTHQSFVDRDILDHMLEAMRNALAIYFYRRIYDLNASMLQDKVSTIRDCLLQCEYADSSVVHGSAGFIWPAFIAACEAEDSKVQASFSTWFELSARRSGLSCFDQTLSSIQQIWDEKQRGNGSSMTWLDLMKKA